MKTISDVQKGMRDAAAWLEEASRDLSDLQFSESKNESVDFQRIQSLGKRYPIQNHSLGKKKSAVFKKQYLTLLAALLQVEPAYTNEGWLFLQRIAAGGGANLALSSLQVDAAMLTSEHLDIFTAAVSRAGMGDALLLDSLLLCLLVQGGRPTWTYISGLAEMLGCTENRLTLLSGLAVAAAKKDADKLQVVLKSCNEVDLTPLLPHLIPIQGYLLFRQDDDTVCLLGDGNTPIPKQVSRKLKGISVPNLIIRDACFTKNQLVISGEKSGHLTMERCSVQNIQLQKDQCFLCSGFSEADFTDCIFQELSAIDTAIDFTNIGLATFHRVQFKDISVAAPTAWALRVNIRRPQFKSVTMEKICSPQYWYYGANPASAESCSYKNCRGMTSCLPENFKKSK